MQVKFCTISCSRSWDLHKPKILEKVEWQSHLLSNFHKLLYTNLCHNTNTLTMFFFSTDIFIKLYLGHPKTCKSTKNWKLKMFTKTILSSTYTKERKKIRHVPGLFWNRNLFLSLPPPSSKFTQIIWSIACSAIYKSQRNCF